MEVGDWPLVWSDEFDRSGGVDLKKWSYEEEFIRNEKAQQLYTKRAKNIRQEKGNLVLQAFAEKRKNKNYEADSPQWIKNRKEADYTSGSVNGRGKFAFQYGKLEVRAKIEYGRGVWPAIWALGANGKWPDCGEIDILEYVSQDKHKVHGTMHWQKGTNYGGGHTKNINEPDLLEGFHTYGMDWTPEKIDLYFDGKKFHTLTLDDANRADGSNPFRQPYYLILNLAIGGWAQKADPADYPRKFVLDYVRLYQDPEQADSFILKNGQKSSPAQEKKKKP